jgi:hypothetical protein
VTQRRLRARQTANGKTSLRAFGLRPGT